MGAGEASREKLGLARACLLPLGPLFIALTGLRRRLYRAGVFTSKELDRPTISVGNITFGGTGKTPFTIFLARRAIELGFAPAVLLRGYGRSTRGARLVCPTDDYTVVGDEALVLASNLPGVPVAVGESRADAARLVSGSCDLFILDDGFQHLSARRDLDIVLLDSTDNAQLSPPPRGRLREPLGSLRFADLICLTRGKPGAVPHSAERHIAGKPLVSLQTHWRDELYPGETSFDRLDGVPLLAFTGVGSPSFFFEQARDAGLDIRGEIAFPDHAPPTPERIAEIQNSLSRTGARALICTEKDAVKWIPAWKGEEAIFYPRLLAEITAGADELDLMLMKVMESRGSGGAGPR